MEIACAAKVLGQHDDAQAVRSDIGSILHARLEGWEVVEGEYESFDAQIGLAPTLFAEPGRTVVQRQSGELFPAQYVRLLVLRVSPIK